MKRALLILTVAVLLPGIAGAQSTAGIYFDAPGEIDSKYYSPVDNDIFKGYIYLYNAEYYITAFEYQLVSPSDLEHDLVWLTEVEYPDNSTLQIGGPWDGHSITYWPPLNGFVSEYVLMATLTFYVPVGCSPEAIEDYLFIIGPHPVSGLLSFTFSPNNDYAYPTGLTSVLCPTGTGVRENSWGAIKSLYR